jgi:UDP-2,3-diacylglucosamine pyrophosphatase LpxH
MNIQKPLPQSKETFEQAMDRMKTVQELREPLNIWKDRVDIKVETGRIPYFWYMPISDLHFGAEGTDYGYIEKALDYSSRNNVQMGTHGDMGDFFNPRILAEAMMDTIAHPDEQMATIRAFYEKYHKNILYGVSGNHDDWVRRTSGVEPYRWLTQDLDVPLLNSGGMLNLNVNGIEYKGLMYHAIGKFGSSFNGTHASKQMLRMQDDADFTVSGHVHTFDIEKTTIRNKQVTAIVVGTPKVEDMFGKRSYGLGQKPQAGFPTLFFDGKKKNIEVIEDIDTAEDHIRALKKFYGARR